MRFRWSRDAGRDRVDIFGYIATDNFTAAAVNDTRIASIEPQLTQFPESGRKGRVAETRELVIAGTPFLAVYRIEDGQVIILRVIHGAQRWPESD